MKYRSWIMAGTVALAAMMAGVTQADVLSLQFVPVGNPGNAADPATGSLYGSVPYAYQMGKYDVTTGQYTAFLNAVAATDTYALYNSSMAVVGGSTYGCGIVRGGSAGSYTYSVATAYQNFPVNEVSWGDAARFCNWLQNGQLTSGVENASTTENGAYTLNGATSSSALMGINRNAGATYFIPSENEWYKAAYYDPTKPGGAGYWTYPTKSNTAPINTLPDTGNHANFYDGYGTGNGSYTDPTNYLTPVGAFAASPGPYGTYDMGGDVFQWNETAVTGSSRGLRGGHWDYYGSDGLASSTRNYADPTYEDDGFVGFRVASVPEPGSLTMLVMIAVTGLLYYRRKHV